MAEENHLFKLPTQWVLGSNDALPLATRMETRLPWRPTRGSLTSPSYLTRNRTLGPPGRRAMKWWGPTAMILAFLTLNFKSPFSVSLVSSRSSLVPLHFLPLKWHDGRSSNLMRQAELPALGNQREPSFLNRVVNKIACYEVGFHPLKDHYLFLKRTCRMCSINTQKSAVSKDQVIISTEGQVLPP